MKILFDLIQSVIKGILGILGFIFYPVKKGYKIYSEYNDHYKKDKKWLSDFNKKRQKSFKDNDECW